MSLVFARGKDCLIARGKVSFMSFFSFMFSFRGRDCLLI